MSEWNNSFMLFNKSLINDEVSYSIKEYIRQFKARFDNSVDIGMLDDYYMNSMDYDKFIVNEESISDTINIRKIIKKYDFELGVDYIVIQKPKSFSMLITPFKSSCYIKMTPLCFKKILLMSGNSLYIKYFIFLETVIQNYETYQKMYNRKTLLDAQRKIKLLEKKIREDKIKDSMEEFKDEFDFSSDSS
jgi:hypothetical protein